MHHGNTADDDRSSLSRSVFLRFQASPSVVGENISNVHFCDIPSALKVNVGKCDLESALFMCIRP